MASMYKLKKKVKITIGDLKCERVVTVRDLSSAEKINNTIRRIIHKEFPNIKEYCSKHPDARVITEF